MVLGRRAFKGTEILGFDEADGSYFTRMFDNAGNHPDYRASVDRDVWTFLEATTRATVTMTDGGDSMKVAWEWRKEGQDWLPPCDHVGTRVA